MRKKLTIMMLIGMISLLNGCSDTTTPETETSAPPVTGGSVDDAKILIAYFSMPEQKETDANSSASRVIHNGELLGNNQFLAQMIQEHVGGKLFAIETQQEYPQDHDELIDFVAKENEAQERPILTSGVENIEDYDIIFLGYPNWWAQMPMPIFSFLDEYDLSNKTIIPFCAHGGSGFSETINAIASQEPNATVITEGFSVPRDQVSASQNDLTSWLDNLDVLK